MTTPLLPEIQTGETGGLHRSINTLEAALDYALIKKDSPRTPNRPTWQATFDTLAQASQHKDAASLVAAHDQLAAAIGETLRATGQQPYAS
ncbi:hypothetical protein IGB42_04073 [Andreprevotia sp. IGB-42]|uniref:hypothetical protein n=1 Tax=Andreprevotia sp. IGB-42 TaxID=2497473 RepID=UPI001357B6C3|nr:hypothetical protein [Andreprevotia sp. IGB-42]KAF0811455.1 hypothetical protein IGB42_04073 [Andreprevotia sp. IGB-42]